MNYNFEVVETAARPAMVIRKITSVSNLPQELGKAYHAVIAYLEEQREQPADMPFAAYYNMDMEKLDVEMGFPVDKALPGQGEITAAVIPGGKKATCLYKGSYEGMVPVYEEMTKWMTEKNLEPTGIVYEFYYNSPLEVPESELLTKIVFLLK